MIAIATRAIGAQAANGPLDGLEQDLDLAGLVSLADPPRAAVKETLAQVTSAGIRYATVAGGHFAANAAIAGEVGIAADRALTGKELDRMDDTTLARAVREVSVFARATATQIPAGDGVAE